MKYIKTFEMHLSNLKQGELDRLLLKHAEKVESLEYIKKLIEHKANVNCRNGADRTPLMLAARKRFYSVMKLFIENGADINAIDRDNNNAFYYLITGSYRARKTFFKIIDFLIENGINIFHKNNQGNYFLDFIKNPDMLNYIKEKYPEIYEEWLLRKEADKYNL